MGTILNFNKAVKLPLFTGRKAIKMPSITLLDVLKWCWGKIIGFVSEVWVIWIALIISIPTSLIIRDGDFSSFLVYDDAGKYLGLNQDRVLLVLGLAFLAAAFDFIKKQRVKKLENKKKIIKQIQDARKELDSQYDLAFGYSSLSVYEFQSCFAYFRPSGYLFCPSLLIFGSNRPGMI